MLETSSSPTAADAVTSHIGFYRTGLTTPEHRRHITVGRAHLVQDVLDSLRQNSGRQSRHHSLFIGLRGMGKTHLLSLIEDEINADPKLAAHYLVVRFPEESLRTLSFADFLLGMVEILASILPEETQWQTLLNQVRTEEDDTRVIDTLVPAIRSANQKHKRTLVVMLENMGEVFTSQIRNKRDIAALRKFFMESKNGCLLIGTATMSFDGITSVDQPFYDFFDVQHLEHLTEPEATSLIRRTLEWEKRQDLLDQAQWDMLHPRLIALYLMTGGSPRLTVMLAQLIAKDSILEVKEQFRILMDRITPFFQDRLKAISGSQECAVLETMATMRDQEKTPASIAKQMRKKASHVSTLLGRLAEQRLVRSSPSPKDKRVRLYTISEGLFDLWLYMNVSRGARERQPFLLDFFASFYPSYLEREKKRAELLTTCDKPERQADALAGLDLLSEVGSSQERARSKVFLANAYLRRGFADDAREILHEATTQSLDRMGTWIVCSAAAEPYPDYLSEIQELITLWDEHRSGNLEGFIRSMRDIGDSFTPFAYSQAKLAFLEAHLDQIPEGMDHILLHLRLGALYRQLAQWQEAEEHSRAALQESESLRNGHLISVSLNNLSLLLKETNSVQEAESLMRRSLAIDEKNFGNNHPDVAIALNNLALLLKDTNRKQEAEALMRRALAIDEHNHPVDHSTIAITLNNLAMLLLDTDRFSEAEPLIRRALSIDEQKYGVDHPVVATDFSNLAQLLKATNRLLEAEPIMRRTLSIAEQSFGDDHPTVGLNLNNLAQLLQDTNRLAEAEPLMRRALAIDEKSFGDNHPTVATDLNNLALLLQDTNRFSEAEPLMRRSLVNLCLFTKQAGHKHSFLETAKGNYHQLLLASGYTPKQAKAKVREVVESSRGKIKLTNAS